MAMAGRLAALLLRRSTVPSRRAISSFSTPSAPAHRVHSSGQTIALKSTILGGWPSQVRHMSTDLSALPDIKDGGILKSLHALLGTTWTDLDSSVEDSVKRSLKSSSDDVTGKEALTDAWRAAQAVEKFGGNMLQELLLEITDLSGGSGEDVKPIPDSTYNAVEAAYKKYTTYLDSFEEDETYIKKKVENELGGLFLQIKQRLSGLDPKWSKQPGVGANEIPNRKSRLLRVFLGFRASTHLTTRAVNPNDLTDIRDPKLQSFLDAHHPVIGSEGCGRIFEVPGNSIPSSGFLETRMSMNAEVSGLEFSLVCRLCLCLGRLLSHL